MKKALISIMMALLLSACGRQEWDLNRNLTLIGCSVSDKHYVSHLGYTVAAQCGNEKFTLLDDEDSNYIAQMEDDIQTAAIISPGKVQKFDLAVAKDGGYYKILGASLEEAAVK